MVNSEELARTTRHLKL